MVHTAQQLVHRVIPPGAQLLHEAVATERLSVHRQGTRPGGNLLVELLEQTTLLGDLARDLL